ncbi:MAG: TIR domain-containing protein [Haliscomenobacteraceae bacterium CHB4]|nr:TIR domain-containing protein [Haliscomenobacteraceae bacterium CHB4]
MLRPKKMKPGDDIYESISKGISWYDKMILVCSQESLSESWWVDRELDRVLTKERDLFKERGKRINLLIPITIDDYVFKWDGAKAEEVRRYVIGDFKDWQDDAKFEKALNDLVHALNADRPDVKPKSLL